MSCLSSLLSSSQSNASFLRLSPIPLFLPFLHPSLLPASTLTRPVGFDDCIEAIKLHAFEASEYPVIITLEDHLPPNLQAKAAEVRDRTGGRTPLDH